MLGMEMEWTRASLTSGLGVFAHCVGVNVGHLALDNNSYVRVVFIDYAKAFDHVDHSIIIKKLNTMGLSHVLVRWLCSFLYDRLQRVKLSEIVSEWITLGAACPKVLSRTTYISYPYQ